MAWKDLQLEVKDNCRVFGHRWIPAQFDHSSEKTQDGVLTWECLRCRTVVKP